jgi:hypothetical protein
MLTPKERASIIIESIECSRCGLQVDYGDGAIAEHIEEAVAAERERCAKLAADVASAIAKGVTDQTIEAVFALPNRIRQGQPAAPQWTSEPPTVPGYYWFRDRVSGHMENGQPVPHVVQVFTGSELGAAPLYFSSAQAGLYYCESFKDFPDGEWCGPLEVPT